MKLIAAILCLFVLAVVSLMVGVGDVSPSSLVQAVTAPDGRESTEVLILLESRLPRTLALLLAGAGMAVSGLIMQMLARNKFVEPTTAGTAESAALGLLVVMLVAPGVGVFTRMLVAAGFAVAMAMAAAFTPHLWPPRAT